MIAALALTTENYKQAIEICKERGGNPKVLVNARMKYFFRLCIVESDMT